jgi:tetratricopeptide (TPR) repeat protein
MITFKKSLLLLFLLMITFPFVLYGWGVKVVSVSGEVQVRKGLDEKWQPVLTGMILEDIDTILSLEGEVVMQLTDDISFTLSRNAMLDIADLRNISKNELFLLLMSRKVKKIDANENDNQPDISNVSVVHAESKLLQSEVDTTLTQQLYERAFNGAKALYNQRFYTNTIIKLDQILSRFGEINDCGEIHYYLGESFEQLSAIGQAIDAYEEALKHSKDCTVTFKNEAEKALKRLKSKKG